MRILLTGVTGQVGGALRVPLSSLGNLIIVGRPELDLSLPDTITAALDRLQPDLIVNPAAYTAVDVAEDEPDLAFRVNGDAPTAMAGWAAAHDVPLVHFSTDYLFDGSGDAPWREDAIPAPLSVYGKSKLVGEQGITKAGGRHLIVRTSWVYAAHGRNFLCTMAKLARERSALRVVADQFGAPTSARIIADTAVNILRQELSGNAFASNSGPVNVSASDVTSWHGFATAIIAGLKHRGANLAAEVVTPIMTSDYPTKAIRPHNSRLDHRRLNDLFHIQMPSWQEALDVELDIFAQGTEGTELSAKPLD
jgi:dTDP-4-dehydrorhamnose reductase